MYSFFSSFFRSHWIRTLFGVLLLAALIWFFGPLIGIGQAHPLDSEIARIIVIAALFVLWIIVNLVHMLNDRKKDKKLVETVSAPDADATASAEEVAVMSERLKEALQKLKKARIGGRSGRKLLYQLPWYMFIGPPGAGKTTALVNSGLNFPLADAQGPAALKGVGGTRNCDWWFTDEAVLIDTAGRYTTQDSQAAVDSGAWLGFLRLLKKHRRRQPLNGVLLAIGISDLAALADTERQAHAQAMRKRLRELHDELGVRIPVYVLFTKTDLLAGFVEFFDNLGKDEREQVWGMTFPVDAMKKGKLADEAGAVARFGAEFDALLARLNDRMLERVNQEADIQRRRLIYGFPQQIASFRDMAGEFLTEIFRPSRLETPPYLRGVYFTSGTQDGTPIDRLLGAMAGQFGLQRQAVAAFSGAGRSYFLTRLLRDVVFNEAGLVSLDERVERRARWTYRGAYAAAALVLLLVTGGWTASYIGNREMIDEVHGAVEHYDAQYAELTKRGPQDTDLAAVLPALNTLRTMRGGYEQRANSTPIALTFGLYQGDKLTGAAIDSYYRALNALLLPRLLSRLETQMQANLDKTDFLYEALKVYLVLGRQGPIDHDQVMAWLITDFTANFAGDDQEAERDGLLAHADALLQRPLTAIPLNGPLVDQVRGILTREPLANYSYNRILRSPRIQALPEWTVADNGGPETARVFTLRSGRPITSGMPGIFTWAGYHTVFLPLLPSVTQDIAEDGWVLGRDRRGGIGGAIAAVSQLRRDVIGLYLDDYERRWDALLADIALKPFANLAEANEELSWLSVPASPMRNLLQGIDAQTQLSRAAASDVAASKGEQKAAQLGGKLAGFGKYIAAGGMTANQSMIAGMLGETFGNTPGTSTPVDPASRVDEHFRALHKFVAGDKDSPPPSPMEVAISKIGALSQSFTQAANAPNPADALKGMAAAGGGAGGGGGGGAGAGGAAQQLRDLAKDVPKPLAAMLTTVTQSSTAVVSGGASKGLADAWTSKVLPLCQAAFNRYPFVAGSAEDVPIDDFTRLLGPGGLMDQFFADNLKPFVDTSSKPWKWQSADHGQLGLSNETLVQFQRAADIRDSLFGGGQQIVVRFTLVPQNLDPQIGQISLDIAGQTLTYNHGPAESMAFQWPSSTGKTLVRVTVTPTAGQASVLEKDGPWALLRLLDAAKVIPSGQPDKFGIVFSGPAGAATFALNANSVHNPFTLGALRAFRCPNTL